VPVNDVVWREETPYHPQGQADTHAVELELQTDKMSKSRGNVVNPDDVIKEYGADALRCYDRGVTRGANAERARGDRHGAK
jgi:valyl-tRNA synthetase